jgi:hypothetical protein
MIFHITTTVVRTVQETYRIEADSAEEARERWYEHNDGELIKEEIQDADYGDVEVEAL